MTKKQPETITLTADDLGWADPNNLFEVLHEMLLREQIRLELEEMDDEEE